MLGISLLHMHIWFFYSGYMDPCSYYMYYCAMLPYSCYMIVSRYWYSYSRYWIHVSCYWYGYSRYWTWELLICYMWTSTSIVPVSRYIDHVILFLIHVILFYAINRAQVQLSCYPYHVLYLFLSPCILDISDHKDNLGVGETWRLIRSYRVMYWIHIVFPLQGTG